MTPTLLGKWSIGVLARDPIKSNMQATFSVVEEIIPTIQPTFRISADNYNEKHLNYRYFSRKTKKYIEKAVIITASVVASLFALVVGII